LTAIIAPPAPYEIERVLRVRLVRDGNAGTATPQLSDDLPRSAALDHLRGLATPDDEVFEQRGITYVYRKRCALSFPTREEFLVGAPAVVESKARYGLDWFEEKWDASQKSLFD